MSKIGVKSVQGDAESVLDNDRRGRIQRSGRGRPAGGSDCKSRPKERGGNHWCEKLGAEPFGQSEQASEQAEGVGGGRQPGTIPEGQCDWRVVVLSGREGEAGGVGRSPTPVVSAGHGKEAGLSWKSRGSH